MEKLLVGLTALFFLVYGVLFALFAGAMSELVTSSVPVSTSGMIDMRATYGGMSIAVGILMLLLASNANTLKLGLLAVAIVLLGMAGTRTLGLVIDGDPNTLMLVYLAAEVLPGMVAIALYRRMK